MIRLNKGPKPASLALEGEALTEAFVANPKTTPWKRQDVVAALEQETFGKCAYCESRVTAVAWTHVEHIRPKSKFPHLVVDWDNLTLACPRCNIYKSDYFDPELPLLNPYVDDVEHRLVFAFGVIRPLPGDASSEATVDLLRLYLRVDLVEQRRAAVMALELLVRNYRRASDPFKEPILEEIREYVKEGAPYVGSLRAYLKSIDFMDFPSGSQNSKTIDVVDDTDTS